MDIEDEDEDASGAKRCMMPFLDGQATYTEWQESESSLQGLVPVRTMPPRCEMDPTGIRHVL